MMRTTGSRWAYRPGDLVINWGNSSLRNNVPDEGYINHPHAVANAIRKDIAWAMLREAGVPTVEWTSYHQTAFEWMRDNDDRVLVRTSLSGSRGQGITVYGMDMTDWARPVHEFLEVGFGDVYVKVFGRNPQLVTEYRVHVVDGQVIDFVQKKRSNSYEGRPNPYVRSYKNGWIFARQEVEISEAVNAASVGAVKALGLDFGAVDIAEDRSGAVCVYEVNTAPGIEGSTVPAYGAALRTAINKRNAGCQYA